MAIVTADGQLTPGEERGSDRRPRGCFVYFAVVQGEEAILDGRETNHVHDIAHLKKVPAVGVDPQAFGAVLKHQRGAELVVGDGSTHMHPLR